MVAYLTLFATAFLAATLLPFYSELLFGHLVISGSDPLVLWSVATAGNTLGSAVNWVLGRYLQSYKDHRWFPFKEDKLGRAQAWFQRYGAWTLLLAWLPVGGDALTFIAGMMRVPFWLFLLLTGLGKGARYAAVLYSLMGFWG